jgi:RNA polymerase sigma-70 factor, ECF subfamily
VLNEPDSIAKLLDEARGGDAQALDCLLQSYREYIRSLIGQQPDPRIQARVDGSDIVQETMLRVAMNIRQFEGTCEQEWKAWLARIADNEKIHQIRHHLAAARRAATRELPSPAKTDGLSRLEEWLARTQTSPSQSAQRNERAYVLAEILSGITADYRLVLVLRHLDGLAFSAVAERMGRSEGAVRVLWTRALRKLREEIDRDGRLRSEGA